jgi:hypothetical protein
MESIEFVDIVWTQLNIFFVLFQVSETENLRKNLAVERLIVEGCDILLDVNQVFVRQGECFPLLGPAYLAWLVAGLPCERWAADTIPARDGFYPERILFVRGTTGFLQSCHPALFDFEKIRFETLVVTVPTNLLYQMALQPDVG